MSAPMPSAPEAIETPRLLLRPPRGEDVDAMFARYTSDPDVTRLVGWPRHHTVDDTRGFLSFSDGEWAKSREPISWRAGGEFHTARR